jgi:hypothetical protein
VRHQGRLGFARALYRAVLHRGHPLRHLRLGWFGVGEIAVFPIILAVGYVWAYQKGALEWVAVRHPSVAATAEYCGTHSRCKTVVRI